MVAGGGVTCFNPPAAPPPRASREGVEEAVLGLDAAEGPSFRRLRGLRAFPPPCAQSTGEGKYSDVLAAIATTFLTGFDPLDGVANVPTPCAPSPSPPSSAPITCRYE